MLNRIHIRNLVIVRSLELSFGQGMTALTGETGAGKSILIDALGLALGAKTNTSVIRQGAERAEVTAAFDLQACPAARSWLEAHDLAEGDECILRRVLVREGRSRSYINGRPAPQSHLQALGELLIDIHGQHAHQSLLRPQTQVALLDAYAGHASLVSAVNEEYRKLRQVRKEFNTLQEAAQDRANRLDYLGFQIDELQAVALAPEQLALLDAEQTRLAHAEQLLTSTGALLDLLDGEQAVADQLRHALQQLDELARLDDGLQETRNLLEAAQIQAQEAIEGLRHYHDAVELDPVRLDEVDRQLGRIHDLARKHRTGPGALQDMLQGLLEERDRLTHADSSLRELENDLRQFEDAYATAAARLSESRRKAADRLALEVAASMQTLSMQGGRFRVDVSHDEQQFQASGIDQVRFLVAANPGQPEGPLAAVASGGELSRISLAIQVATAGCGQIPTLIFDEVDVGIGGGTAEVVGRLLRELGQARQILCVTHLAQVAAQANGHLRVSKTSDERTTETRIDMLRPAQRIDEVARMLGGVEITEQTLAHAREMLENAL